MNLQDLAAEASRSRRTASEVVTEALREAILRGILKGGQRLGQEELAAQFGVAGFLSGKLCASWR